MMMMLIRAKLCSLLWLLTLCMKEVLGKGGALRDNEYIFGFSTGHVGTTSLATKSIYRSGVYNTETVMRRLNEIHFEHEMKATRLEHGAWVNYDHDGEFQWVKTVFFRSIKESMKPSEKCFFDDGHHTLYFIYGLIRYLTELNQMNNDNLRYTIVRIRRNRIETAMSLTFPHDSAGDPIRLRTRYVPFERTDDVVLKLPKETWDNFTNFQKALWQVDETEARWEQLISNLYFNRTLRFREIYWESTEGLSNHTFAAAVEAMRRILRVHKYENQTQTCNDTHEVTSHGRDRDSLNGSTSFPSLHFTHPHVPRSNSSWTLPQQQLRLEEKAYMQIMKVDNKHLLNFAHLPSSYNMFERP
jgi:hypothetical protein